MNKKSFHIAVLFSALVFLILTVTMVLASFITVFLLKIGAISNPQHGLSLIVFAVASIIVGTVFSHIFGRRPLDMIRAIDNATKEVVKGNFNIQLNEEIPAAELRSMAQNFNAMVRELSNTEIFRTDFVENVSHEFKTPLSAIEGYVMLLQNKSLSEEKRAEYTNRILLNTRRLSSLTGNILLLSRLENQELEVKKETYSLDEQLREIILLFETQWTEKNLEMDIDLCSVDYTGNQEMLLQVWQNIFENAMKFVPQGGQIRVLLRKKENCVKVSIVDNGIGMSEDVLARIYEKFYQADSSRTSVGNGLGLTLAKRIVDLHGGKIEVSSKVRKGTSFTVTLPL
jgi:signal transduction histidine kinase